MSVYPHHPTTKHPPQKTHSHKHTQAVRVGPASAAPPGATSSQRALGIHDRKLVRTDPRMQTLHAFTIMPSSQTGIMPSSQTGGAAGGGDILNVTDATAVDMEVDEEGAIFTQQQLTSTAGAAADRGTVGEGTQGPTQGPTQGVPGTAAAALMHSTARRRGAARAAGPASLRYETKGDGKHGDGGGAQ